MKAEDYESPRSFFPIPTAFDMAGVHFISLSDLPSRDAESYGTQGSQAVCEGGGQRVYRAMWGHVGDGVCLLFHDGLSLLFIGRLDHALHLFVDGKYNGLARSDTRDTRGDAFPEGTHTFLLEHI